MRRQEESSHQQQLMLAKRSYKAALEEGSRQEEARWANVIANIYKNRGEYVEAINWLRKDYDISIRYLPEKHLFATCQSLGEVYLRLRRYEQALIYQKKHLEMANDAGDLIEQQRATTQLGRTYHEIFLNFEEDHSSIRNAEKYFKLAMKLALTIKKNPGFEKGSFVKEYIDAYNNIGMLQIDLDNYDEAEKILKKGLMICDEEEVAEDDDARSRLHHNLGNVYLELRKWTNANEHIKKDIVICKKIGHCQGEAKGYINLGELLYRNQKYNEAVSSYRKAFELAKSLEDERALAKQIEQNIETVKEAMKVMVEMKKEEQNLKRLERNTQLARGKENERDCLLKQNASIDSLIEKSRMIIAWPKLREFAKRKKRTANELCDKEKLSDSFLVVGESYQNLRKFNEALKWYKKGLESFKSIGNLEGQALAKINIGDILDSCGDWTGALGAFREAYRIAIHANLPSVQLSALENIHYSHMIRFNDAEEARKTKLLIDQLKQSKSEELEAEDKLLDRCSETETELDNGSSDGVSDDCFSMKSTELNSLRSNFDDTDDDWDGDIPLKPLLRSNKKISKKRAPNTPSIPRVSPNKSPSRSIGSLTANRKRPRMILSDDEGEEEEVYCSEWMVHNTPSRGVNAPVELMMKYPNSPVHKMKEASPVASRCSVGAHSPVNLIKSPCSAVDNSARHRNVNAVDEVHAPSDDHHQQVIFKIDGDWVHMDANVCVKLSMEQLKTEMACLYYLQLTRQKRSRGLVPVIEHMKYSGRILESTEALCNSNEDTGNGWVDVSVNEMVPRHLMKLYVECCNELAISPSLEVVKNLYNPKLPDDEIIVSDCKLQDLSVAPLLKALQLHKTLAVLDLSHNQLGNETVEKLKLVFISSGQNEGSLILNLHNNRLGAASLYHIRECPVLFDRLEVLNISGNRLTDACASYLSTILQACKALYSLDIENCSITSRTVQKIADSLNSESALTHLYLGYNNPVSGSAIISLLHKLGTINRFQELNLNGINLTKPVVDGLCQLAKDCCLSGLMLGNTNIGTEGAMQLIKPLSKETQELARLDLSFCGVKWEYIFGLSNEVALFGGILDLNLGGNPITEEGGRALASLLMNPQCRLRILAVNKCELGIVGVLSVLQALSTNFSLQELNLAENVDSTEIQTLTDRGREIEDDVSTVPEPEALQNDINDLDVNDDQLVVADSEDDRPDENATSSILGDGKVCSSDKRSCLSRCSLMQLLTSSIKLTQKLQQLDISQNGFTGKIAEMLYSAWSSGHREGLTWRHIDENILHFSVQGTKCCSVKSCCRRN